MSGDILGISVSGLKVSQNALRTVGHNIANANTEGYSRQATEINSVGGAQSGVGFLGSGAYTGSIERVVNEFVTGQLRQDTTLYSELNAYNQNILQLNTLLADGTTGLTQGVQSFFAAVQTVADDPTSMATRQLFVSEAENLSDSFNTLAARLDDINRGVNAGVQIAVQSVNNLTSMIASLNNNIAEVSGSSSSSPNDLLDQRDEALKELSKLVSVNVSYQDDNQINIMVGNGIPLVLGSVSTDILLGQNEFNPSKAEISLNNSAVGQFITSAFTGGEIGGLFNFQSTIIDPTYNEIGRVALAVADNFNQLQQQGITLNNSFGSNIFSDINDSAIASNRIFPSANNLTDDVSLRVSIDDSAQLTSSDYLLSIDSNAGIYRINRLSDNTELVTALVPTTFPTAIIFDGLSLTIDAANFNGGDQFLIQATRTAAHNFSAVSLEPEGIALASPLQTETDLGNLGSATINSGEVLGLVDAAGQSLGLFSQSGQMSPPLLVKFTTSTTYDILDNSNPGNPVQLSPPIRNQVYVQGIENSLFTTDNGQTSISSAGALIGLPTGSSQATQAALKASAVSPVFAAIDFSDTANQFSFNVAVSNTLANANDGTFTVTIDDASISSNAELLTTINDDLIAAGSRVRAYITDVAQGSALAFASLDHGVGDITLQTYNPDPDANLDNAPVGQANTLLGFDIEASTFTSVGGADGISGIGSATNNYPVETLTIVTTDPVTAITTSQNIFSAEDASARTTASLLNNVSGVTANASNYVEFRSSSLTLSAPLQLELNGEPLIDYDSGVVSGAVPSTALNSGEDFNDYLADTINANTNLQALGIYALSAYDAVNDEFYVKVNSSLGDDFTVELTAAASGGGSIAINDGANTNVTLTGSGTNTTSQAVVGGRIDLDLADNMTLSTTPVTSSLFGDSSGANFAQTAYLGIQASISGTVSAGDLFSLNFNANAEFDNRNALTMAGLQQAQTMDGGTQSFQQTYNQLVESIGIKASGSINSTSTAEKVLEQTENLRNSISGVNLDEEAANLIKFEQLYSANAQVITVARDLFDRLLNSF
ncbi:MAG: flagellar hook-associated protein 1 FlgK [Kiritimatiellia bacterium]|jgi:flagellar hook-associated protein 1 FlgK